MLGIDYLEPNNKNRDKIIRQTISSLTSISGYIVGSIVIGMYIDKKFFNNGISVVIAAIIGIILVTVFHY
jgi:F0F1-type ATP synthase assembly protein I